MKLRLILIVITLVIIAGIASYFVFNYTGKTQDQAPIPHDLVISNVTVDSLDLLVMESFPVQVNAVAKGYLPDPCTEIDEVETYFEADTFTVNIKAVKPIDAVCSQQIKEFERVIPLEVLGLPAGTYTVTVNGVTQSFDLTQDNTPIEDPLSP